VGAERQITQSNPDALSSGHWFSTPFAAHGHLVQFSLCALRSNMEFQSARSGCGVQYQKDGRSLFDLALVILPFVFCRRKIDPSRGTNLLFGHVDF